MNKLDIARTDAGPEPPISVVLVEDNRGLRESLAVLLNGTPEFRCAAAFSNAEAALKQIREIAPDVVLMDIELPGGMSGVACVPKVKELVPRTRVLMLTIFADPKHIFEALKAGASGYLSKRTPPADLLKAIAEVQAGGAPMSSEIAAQVVAYFHQQGAPASNEGNLSPRESEILDLLARGFLYKEIADQLKLSYETVHWHLRNVYQKLHVRSRSEAIRKYLLAPPAKG